MAVSNTQGVSPKAVRVADAAGSLKRHLLAQAANPHEAVRPPGANAKPLGLALETVPQLDHVAIQNAGEAVCVAAGAIAVGADVNIADALGRVKTVNEATGTRVNKVGRAVSGASAAGDHITISLEFEVYAA